MPQMLFRYVRLQSLVGPLSRGGVGASNMATITGHVNALLHLLRSIHLTLVDILMQSWSESIHGLGWVGLGRDFEISDRLGWVKDDGSPHPIRVY